MTRVCGAKRLGLKIEAKRLGGKRPGGKRLGGETSCYPFIYQKDPKYRKDHEIPERPLKRHMVNGVSVWGV